MSLRYFSPDSYSTVQKVLQKKLRWVGSMTKLPSLNQSQKIIKNIGNKTYHLEKQIGSGYSSKVYRAKVINNNSNNNDPQDQINNNKSQFYAIKIIELKKYSHSNMQMLENQIQILQTLNHPHIVKCYSIQKTSTHCYIITQYCENGDLLQYLTRKRSFQEHQASQIMKDIISGYKYLIRKGIIHRDLKPANILRSLNSWKIADFGFSVLSENDIKSKYNVGTPLYMPIQSLNLNIYSVKSDIFAIGIIFYQLLVGCTPWQCKTEKQLMKKLIKMPFTIPQKILKNLTEYTIDFLNKACAIEYQQRMNKQQFLKCSIDRQYNDDFMQQSIKINPQQIKINPSLTKYSSQNKNEQEMKKILLKKTLSIPQFHSMRIKQVENQFNKNKLKIIDNRLNLKTIRSNDSKSKSTTSDQDKKTQEAMQIENKNYDILVNQIHFCRFIYYFIKNAGFTCLSESSRDKLCLVLFKHILKNVKMLADQSNNYFNLKNFQIFKQTTRFKSINRTIKQYSARYEKQYLVFLKKLDIKTIREINRQMRNFNNIQNQYNNYYDFYKTIKQFVAIILRQYNHNLSTKLHEFSYILTPQLKASIHGLYSLTKYYQLIDYSSKIGYLDLQKGLQAIQRQKCTKLQIEKQKELTLNSNKNSKNKVQSFDKTDLKVYIDYRSAPNYCLLEDYVNLRKQIKNI